MTNSQMNPKVDSYFRAARKWRVEMEHLRTILLGCGLGEELKWGKPCYTFRESNVVILLGLKDYIALLFCKGALLKDAKGIMVKAGENTQAARQIRFTSLAGIEKSGSTLKAYIKEAMAAEKAGLEVKYKPITEHKVPEEFQKKLDLMPALKSAYEALTPGRRRAYLIFFSGAKQSATRESRIEKCMPQILKGKGLND